MEQYLCAERNNLAVLCTSPKDCHLCGKCKACHDKSGCLSAYVIPKSNGYDDDKHRTGLRPERDDEW